jgi:photosystem II stability/assembly factor-like uncharacterized protein
MHKGWQVIIALTPCVAIASCGGSGGSGGKSSVNPLVVNLSATPSPAWLNAAVTFSVACVSSSANDKNFKYIWSFGDGGQDTTTAPTDVHNYTTAGTYSYSVQCIDEGNGGASTTSPASSQYTLDVQPFQLNSVASGVCSSGAQGIGWCWQNPLPTGRSLRAVAALSPLVGWVAGDAGVILETNDGGIHWVAKYTQQSLNFLGIHVTDQNNAFVVADTGQVLSTTDAGANWSAIDPATPQGLSLTSVSIVDSNDIWAINSDNSVFQYGQSQSGGHSWVANSTSNLPVGGILTAIAATDATTAWVVGSVGLPISYLGTGLALAGQKDGAGPWAWYEYKPGNVGSGLGTGVAFTSVSLPNTRSPSVCGKTATSSVWIGGFAYYDTSGAGLPAEGLIPISLESTGTTGMPLMAPAAVTPYPTGGLVILAFDQKSAWATVGSPNGLNVSVIPVVAINVTSNGNTNWQNRFIPQTPSLNALASNDCVHGWAVGDAGSILATADRANTWSSQTTAESGSVGASNLISIAGNSPDKAFALAQITPGIFAADLFQVFSTTDGGLTWLSGFSQKQGSYMPGGNGGTPTATNSGQIAVNKSGYAVAAGPGYLISYSPSNMVGWDPITDESIGVVGINDAPFTGFDRWASVSMDLGGTSAWVIDILGNVLEEDLSTIASGSYSNWRVASAAPITTGGGVIVNRPNAIAAVSSSTAVVVGNAGSIEYTTRNGNTWQWTQVLPVPTSNDMQAISIAGSGTGWAVGDKGTILKTTDNGRTWKAWSAANWIDSTMSFADVSHYCFNAVSTPDGANVWAIGQPIGQKGTLGQEATPCNRSSFAQPACSPSCKPAILVYSADDGATWKTQPTGAQFILSVAGVNANSAWIVGTNGTILKTMTAGNKPPTPN